MEQKNFNEIMAALAVLYKKIDDIDVKVNGKSKPMAKSVSSYLDDLRREAQNLGV